MLSLRVDHRLPTLEFIVRHYIHHIFPMQALGSRHAGAPHKCEAWLRAHQLQADGWPMVKALADLYYMFCVDRGPERSVSNIDVDPSEAFPFWPDEQPEDDLASLMDLDSPNIRTGNSLDCTGPFHTVENIEKRVLGKLEGWIKYKNGLGYACIYMHAGHTRDLYKENAW